MDRPWLCHGDNACQADTAVREQDTVQELVQLGRGHIRGFTARRRVVRGVTVKKTVERSPADSEETRGLLLVAVRRFEHSEDAFALKCAERAGKVL